MKQRPRRHACSAVRYLRRGAVSRREAAKRWHWCGNLRSPRWPALGETEREFGWEQYKLYVQMADQISARRATFNNMLLVANTAIVGVAGLLAKDCMTVESRHCMVYQCPGFAGTVVCGVAGVGFLVCVLWLLGIWSYAQKTAAKGKVHNGMEAQGYVPLTPFCIEEQLLQSRWSGRPSWFEYGLPVLFQLAYGAGVWILIAPALRALLTILTGVLLVLQALYLWVGSGRVKKTQGSIVRSLGGSAGR